jgi:hypothetical protein
MRKATLATTLGFLASLLLMALPAVAASDTEDFSGFTAEDPLTAANATANGWKYTDGAARDVAIEASGINGNSLRMSNAVMDDSFGNWVFSEPLGAAATENGLQEFTAEFDIASMRPSVLQEGLQISVAPQTAGGARMSFLRFNDTSGGIKVTFADASSGGLGQPANFRQVPIATLDRSVAHHVKIVLDLYPGPSNDVAQVFIDWSDGLVPATGSGFEGFFAPVDKPDTVNKAKAGQAIPLKFKVDAEPATTWEDYYRFDPESNGGVPQSDWTTRPVDSLIFQARGSGTQAGVDGYGFLIDNVTTSSTGTPTLPTAAVGDPSVFGDDPFTADSVACDLGDDIDPIEVYAPGGSGLTYNAETGVWHYNWKTPKSIAGSCVDMILNLTDDYASFRFVK